MQRITCEQCDASQPIDWRAGDLCGHCGGAVREETRCAWCTQWTPQGKFCRSCGCGLVPLNQYGAARMLKNAGVDQLSLPQRLAELDPEQSANFQRLYQTHLAIILNRTEELRLCETYLVLRGHTDRLEEKLIKRLPLDEAAQKELQPGPRGPYSNQPERIKEIAEHSPIATTQILASLAWIRYTDFAETQPAAAHFIKIAIKALKHEDETIRLEAAVALAHWRCATQPISNWVDWNRVAEIGRQHLNEPRAKYWAAAAATCVQFADTLADKNLVAQIGKAKALIEEAKASRDPDLVFTAALRTADVDLITRHLASDSNWRTETAVIALAMHQATQLAPFIENGPDDLVVKVLRTLKSPVNDKLLPALLSRISSANEEIVKFTFERIKHQLDKTQVLTLLKTCQANHGHALFSLMLPEFLSICPEEIIQTAIKLDMFEGCREAWKQAVENSDLPESAIQAFTHGKNAARLKLFTELVDTMLRRKCENVAVFYLPLVKLLLEQEELGVVESAASTLLFHNKNNEQDAFRFAQKDIISLYPELNDFIVLLHRLLANEEFMRNMWIADWLTELLESYNPAVDDVFAKIRTDLLELFLAALLAALRLDHRKFLRAALAKTIHAEHTGPEFRARLFQELNNILATPDIDYDIVYHIEKAAERLTEL
jgi:hypothetical protein